MRVEPKDGGVQGAEDGAGCEGGIGKDKCARADAGGDQVAEASFVSIALDQKALLKMRRDGVGQEMGGGAFDFVEDTVQMKGDEGAEFFRGADLCAASFFKVGNQTIECAVLAKEENFVFAMEIVV